MLWLCGTKAVAKICVIEAHDLKCCGNVILNTRPPVIYLVGKGKNSLINRHIFMQHCKKKYYYISVHFLVVCLTHVSCVVYYITASSLQH